MPNPQPKSIDLPFGRFLSNTPDPFRDGNAMHMCYSLEAMMDPTGELMRREWESYMHWIRSNVIVPPKSTEHYTTEQLKAMGMVGIYAPDPQAEITSQHGQKAQD
jgi:hypothetical protein